MEKSLKKIDLKCKNQQGLYEDRIESRSVNSVSDLEKTDWGTGLRYINECQRPGGNGLELE